MQVGFLLPPGLNPVDVEVFLQCLLGHPSIGAEDGCWLGLRELETHRAFRYEPLQLLVKPRKHGASAPPVDREVMILEKVGQGLLASPTHSVQQLFVLQGCDRVSQRIDVCAVSQEQVLLST